MCESLELIHSMTGKASSIQTARAPTYSAAIDRICMPATFSWVYSSLHMS